MNARAMPGFQWVPGPIFEVVTFKAGDAVTWFDRPRDHSSLYRPQSIYPLDCFYIDAIEVIGLLPVAPLVLWISNYRVLSVIPELCRAMPVAGRTRGYELGTALVLDADSPFSAALHGYTAIDGSAALVLHGRGLRKRPDYRPSLTPRSMNQGDQA